MTCPVGDLFEIRYGHSLGLNRLVLENPKNGIPFISRQQSNNGISSFVAPIHGVDPAPAGDITCALSGNGVLTTHIQELPFYTGYHVAILRPKQTMTKAEILFYCLCIKGNRYRYSYGRQANKSLARLVVPSQEDIPEWVNASNLKPFHGAIARRSNAACASLGYGKWVSVKYKEIFEIKKGCRLTKAQMTSGSTPFIGAIASNNGVRQYVSASPNHLGNTITVTYNGSVAEAFYQPEPYWASDDVNVLYPKFEMNVYVANVSMYTNQTGTISV